MRKADFASYGEMINSLELFLCEVPERCETIVAASQCLVDILENDPKAYKMNSILQRCTRDILGHLNTIREIRSSLEMDRYVFTPLAPPQHFER